MEAVQTTEMSGTTEQVAERVTRMTVEERENFARGLGRVPSDQLPLIMDALIRACAQSDNEADRTLLGAQVNLVVEQIRSRADYDGRFEPTTPEPAPVRKSTKTTAERTGGVKARCPGCLRNRVILARQQHKTCGCGQKLVSVWNGSSLEWMLG